LPVNEDAGLNSEERKAYHETIDQFLHDPDSKPEDQEVLSVTMTEVIFKPGVYRVNYEQWKANWEGNPALSERFPKLEDYALEQGKAMIKAGRNEIVSARLRKFQEDSMPESLSRFQQELKLKEINAKALQFIEKHEGELLAYSGLKENDPKREQLFKQFVQEIGLEGSQMAAASVLFKQIIDDVEVGFTAGKKLDARNGRMVERVQKAIDENSEIDENDWNKMLDEELLKDKDFNEVMREQQAVMPQAAGAGENLAAGPVLDSVQSVALAGGLQLDGYTYDKVTNTYNAIVRYPDSEFVTTMTIVPHPELGDIKDPRHPLEFEHADFVFKDPYTDADKGGEAHFKALNIRSGCNQMFLDYLLNARVKPSPNFDVNGILKDEMMVRMAERILGRNLNTVVLSEEIRGLFTRFFGVLVKGDGTGTPYGDLGSFEARVKIMDRVLLDPVKAKLIQDEFKKVGSETFTVSTLLQLIGYKE
jgi:hypothetical protein